MVRRRSGCAFLLSLLRSRRLVRFFSVPTAVAAASPPKPRRIPTSIREHDSSGAHPDPRRTQVPAAALCAEGRFQEAVDALFRQRGRVCDAVRLLDDFKVEGRPVPPAVYLNLFRLSLDHCALDEVRRVYGHAVSSGFHPGILIAMLAKSGSILDARHVFDHMPARDACSRNTEIAAYAKAGNMAKARRLFDEMPGETKDSFSWSTMMSGYVRHDRPVEALRLYREMQMTGKTRCNNNKFTVSSALAASAAIWSRRFGKEIHGHIIRGELTSDAVVWSALSDMYAKCGAIAEARHIFDGTPDKDVVSWSAMIGRYFDAGRYEDGLGLFSEMLRSGMRPDEFTFSRVLNACSQRTMVCWMEFIRNIKFPIPCESDRFSSDSHANRSDSPESGRIRKNPIRPIPSMRRTFERTMERVGKEVHGHMMRIGWDPFSFAAGALIDMYSKCGNIESARKVFEGMPQPDLVSWTCMIAGLAQNGHPEEALRYFESLLKAGTKPDHITFVGVLSACTHAGLVDKGVQIFHSIETEHGLVDHFAYVVNHLSRAFKEVENIMWKIPLWASFFGVCGIGHNRRLARLAADFLIEVEPENAAEYDTLAIIYASGLWKNVSELRNLLDDRRVVKKPGFSWIEVERRVHRFLVGDESHPRIKEIHAKLDELSARMKEEGYVPDTNFVLHDVEDEQKEQNLLHHSEKLAVAFGIIATPPQTPIKVYKNLCICGDCHTAIKFISRIAEREIIVRDSGRFHHFKHGTCTCKDYW